jgi:hypothetical protein
VAGTGRLDEGAVLAFAKWLEKNGDQVWAEYVRLRCAMDGKMPGEDYPDNLERCLELAAGLKLGRAEFEGLYFSGYRFAEEKWWEDNTDDMEWGLPSRVDAVSPGKGAGPVSHFIKRLESLVRVTPVRGIDLERHFQDEMASILLSAGARQLRALAFNNEHGREETGQAMSALVQSPLVRTLDRLRIDGGLSSDGDALALAGASFARLHRLDLLAYHGIDCSPKAVTQLMTAPWFRDLQQLHTGFSEDCCETGMLHLGRLPKLHSLTIWKPPDRQMRAMGRGGEFESLRRLYIYCANLTGKYGEALCQLKAPRLIELWLGNSSSKAADIRTIVAAPFFEHVRVLTFAGPQLDETGLESLARSGCAPMLRILRLHCGGSNLVGTMRSLGKTSLTMPNAFSNITSLQIEYPYSKKARRDTADFLRRLTTQKLRHLTLTDCDIDDECATALATSPTFANLTRLKIEQGYKATNLLSPKAAEMLFRSRNLQNLVELEFHNFALGNSLSFLSSESVLPNLACGSFWGTNAPKATVERIKSNRPIIHVGS